MFRRSRHRRPGFTLVEILVVLAIILIASLIALPLIRDSLTGRSITDAAQVLTGAIAGARDAAIRQNEPRGLRLMPDPMLTLPAVGTVGAGTLQLAYNRLIPIEPAADYTAGKFSVGPQLPPGGATATFPPAHPITNGATYPFPDSSTPANVLMIEESPFVGGFITPGAIPNEPVNWWWNVRVGDKIKFGDTGRAYTVVGPCTINPKAPLAINQGNLEWFVNVGPPGTPSPLVRTYYDSAGNPIPNPPTPEFLFLVNGEDDDHDGYVDQGWDGYDQNADGVVDDALEWTEREDWVGLNVGNLRDSAPSAFSPSPAWANGNGKSHFWDSAYSIERRPVPTPGGREILLPAGVVIDATSWNKLQERSRLPVDPGSLSVDVMLNPNGSYVPTTMYSSATSMNPIPFLDFWLAAREDVYARGAVWGTTAGVPNPNPANTASVTYYELPLDADAMAGTTPGPGNYPPATASPAPVLKNDRRLVTLFARSGMVVTSTLDTVQGVSPQPSEGFNTTDVNQPFYKAHLGQREVK
jgi:prepilin-type N-terminal cleavage/methylation domain-containing protein